MQIIQKKLADIVPYANNTKKHDEKIGRASCRERV